MRGWTPRLAALVGAGWLFGALGLGVPLSLLHVLHSQVTSPRDALVTLVWFLVLYGGLSALGFLAAGGVRLAFGGTMQRAVGAGVLAVTTLFVGRYLHMGLTYGEVPSVLPHTPASMLLYVAVRIAAVAGGALLLARALAPSLASVALVHRRVWLVTIAVIVGAHVLAPTILRVRVGPAGDPMVPPRAEAGGLSVVFVGIDGADWAVLDPMLAAGTLPALAQLQRQGSAASLATIEDANSSEIWASIYTGKQSAAHGIEDFLRITLPGMQGPGLFAIYGTFFPNLAGYLERVRLARRSTVDRDDLRAMPVWEMALVGGLSVGIVNAFYYSYPPPLLTVSEGFVVGYGTARDVRSRANGRPLESYVQPAALAARLRPALDEPEVAWQRTALRALLGPSRPRFLHVYTREPDRTQHRYWKWYQPEYFLCVSAADQRRLGGRIPAINREIDALVAEVLPLAGPDTVVIVASDHGHSPTMLHPQLYSHHQHGPPGVLLMAGGPVRAGARLTRAHVYDLAPTMLYLLGLPVPEDAAGRVLTEALRPEALAARPVRRIGSYEAFQGRLRYASDDDPAHAADEIDRLRALGYVE